MTVTWGGVRKSWSDKVTEDQQNIEMTWTDYAEIADKLATWNSRVSNVFQNTWKHYGNVAHCPLMELIALFVFAIG